ncbi:unnamed protein product [Rhizopus stolonifer]
MPHTRLVSHSFVDSLKATESAPLKSTDHHISDKASCIQTDISTSVQDISYINVPRLSLEKGYQPRDRVSFESKNHHKPVYLHEHEEPIFDNSSNHLKIPKAEKVLSRISRTSTENTCPSVNNDNYIPPSTRSMPTSLGSVATLCELQLASTKKNKAFHELFKSVPQTDMLIEVYKCALQKEILLQGHMYVSEHHVCFKSNIFGWVTNLIIHFDEITLVEKRMTAKIIPNGIMIDTHTAKHIFASFIFRDQAYERIVKIWRLHKSMLSPSPSNYSQPYEDSDGDSISSRDLESLRSIDSAILRDSSQPTISRELHKVNSVPQMPIADKKSPKAKDISSTTKRHSRSVTNPYSDEIMLPSFDKSKQDRNTEENLPNQFLLKKEFTCPCIQRNKTYKHVALDKIYPGTVEGFDKLFFEGNFTKRIFEQYENYEDVQLEDWVDNSRKIIATRLVKSSTAHAKLTRTVLEEKREHNQLPYYSCATIKKLIPDAPMGAVYSIKSRTNIICINAQEVRVLVTFEVAFKKSGLVSSIIETNAAYDQSRYYSHIDRILSDIDLATEMIQDKDLLKMLKLGPDWNTECIDGWIKLPIQLNILLCVTFVVLFLIQLMLLFRLEHVSDDIQGITDNLKEPKLQINDYEQLLDGLIETKKKLDLDYVKMKELVEM